MGICYIALNLTRGEFIDPAVMGNDKHPYDGIAANFIVYMMQYLWKSDHVVLVGDCCDPEYDWYMKQLKYHPEMDVTMKYWKMFVEDSEYDVEKGRFKWELE
jgi:hypothetical protein